MKKFLMLIMLSLCLVLTSCGNEFKNKYKKIKTQSIEEIVEILGKADEKFAAIPDFNHNCYYWFDKDYSFDEAKQHCVEEKIMYIGVVIDVKTKKCIGKAYGQVTHDLKTGDINVLA